MEHPTQPVEHPAWCIKGKICTVDGIHHSRPLTATPDDALDAVRVWLEQAHTVERLSVVLETTVEGNVGYTYLTVGQARVLVHQVRRLLNMGGQR
ncbi:hypothetical protein [Micromonospora chersina]|uniref:hypothetical protein n=1 Tax=Micromonospora chersina TaxID=47854 RepID=UPI003D8DC8F5